MLLPKPSLRVLLAAAFGSVALLAALAASLLAGEEASRRLRSRILDDLRAEAEHIAERLDREMFARWRDVQVVAALPAMRSADTPPDARRALLAPLHDTYRDYALLAFIGPDGRVVADSRRLLEGADASGRPFVREAMRGPVVADVHDAAMLAGQPGPAAGVEPLRVVDIAAPVRDAEGRLIGVVAAHLDWRWADGAVGPWREDEPQAMILSRDGELLLGPRSLLGRRPALPPAGAGEVAFPDGSGFLAATAATRGYRDYPGLGWRVLVRRPAEAALAPVRAVQRDILLYGMGAALVAAALGWLAARGLAVPLRRLAEAAGRQRRREPGAPPLTPRGAGYAEAATLAAAMDDLLGDCRRTEAALRESEERLRLAQRAGQIGTYEWDVLRDVTRTTEEYAALHGLPSPAGEGVWHAAYGAWATRLAEEDRERMAAEVQAAVASPGPYEFEYRIRLPGEGGALRWLADRGEVFADADGRAARALGAVRDVTARREAERALRESEARLRLAQEAAGIGTWELDLASGAQVWSDRQYALFGLDPAAGPPSHDRWRALVHPDDRAAVDASRAAAAAPGGGEFALEFRVLRPSDGALRWIASRGRVERDALGRPARMIGINLDLTVLREREAALAAREAALRAMLEANPIGVLRGDVHGRILDANEALLRVLGRGREELASGRLRWDAITPPEWLPLDEARIAEAARDGACTPYEKEYLRPDGSRVPVLVGCALLGEAREESVAFVLDLTERKRAEAALLAAKEGLERRVAERTAELAAREAELRRIYDRTPGAFHSVDADGRLVRVSEQWLAFLGYAEHAVLGRRTGEFMTPESAARWGAAVAELKAAGGEVREVEYEMVRRDGRPVDVLLRARAEHDAEGRFLRSYAVLFDLTERNRAEARLREAQKLEALGRVAGGVAHDFNNLLQVVTSALRLIQAHPDRPERVRRYAGAALEAAERGAGVTRRMLSFARQDRLDARPVPVRAALEGLRGLLKGPLGPGIALEVSAAPDLPPVQTDRVQLDLALFNLALNARDAMPAGGTLRIAAAAEQVSGQGDPRGLRPGRYVRLTVADTGAGMDAATLARAAEPFFTTKEVGKGTGLGLSMAHGFAVQSGGALAIESHPGQGTGVHLWLPAAPPDASEGDSTTVPPAAPRRGTAAVLLVEDEAAVRGILAAALRDAGLTVTEAASAAEALRLLDQGGAAAAFDAIITDHAMPETTGAALAAELLRRGGAPPLLILTGNAEAPLFAVPDGVALMRKPVDPAALVAWVADRTGAEGATGAAAHGARGG